MARLLEWAAISSVEWSRHNTISILYSLFYEELFRYRVICLERYTGQPREGKAYRPDNVCQFPYVRIYGHGRHDARSLICRSISKFLQRMDMEQNMMSFFLRWFQFSIGHICCLLDDMIYVDYFSECTAEESFEALLILSRTIIPHSQRALWMPDDAPLWLYDISPRIGDSPLFISIKWVFIVSATVISHDMVIYSYDDALMTPILYNKRRFREKKGTKWADISLGQFTYKGIYNLLFPLLPGAHHHH